MEIPTGFDLAGILLVVAGGLLYLVRHIAERANQGQSWGAKARVLVRPTSGMGWVRGERPTRTR